jgi:hypothetical protein
MQRLSNNLLAMATVGMIFASGSMAIAAGHGGGHSGGVSAAARPMTRPMNQSRTQTIPHTLHDHFAQRDSRDHRDWGWHNDGIQFPIYGDFGTEYAIDPGFSPALMPSNDTAVEELNPADTTATVNVPKSKPQVEVKVTKPVVTTVSATPAPVDNYRKASSCLWMAKSFVSADRPEKVREYAQKAIDLAPDTAVAQEANELLGGVK